MVPAHSHCEVHYSKNPCCARRGPQKGITNITPEYATNAGSQAALQTQEVRSRCTVKSAKHSYRQGFLSLSTTDFQSWRILCSGHCPMQGRTFSSIPGFYPLDKTPVVTGLPPQAMRTRKTPGVPRVPERTKQPPAESPG